mgnify:CR=1 FL=1
MVNYFRKVRANAIVTRRGNISDKPERGIHILVCVETADSEFSIYMFKKVLKVTQYFMQVAHIIRLLTILNT